MKQKNTKVSRALRREGYVLTRICPSVCPHPGRGGDTPARGTPVGGYPTSGTPNRTWPGGTLARGWGYHTSGTPHQTWPGGGVPHLRYPPLSDLARGVPQLGYPSIRPGRGGGGVYPTSGNGWSTAVGMPLAFTQEDFLGF